MSNLSSLQRRSTGIAILLIFALMSCTNLSINDISQWRGDNRDGIYNETELLDKWPENGPDLLWSTEGLGIGYAAPVITKDKIFVNGTIDSISHLFALDHEGIILWKTPNGEQFVGEGFSATYPGARSTPTVVGDLVYTSSGMGRVMCCDINTGDAIWEVDMIKDFDGLLPYFGIAESPLIDDEKLYCFPSGLKNNFVALDLMTGETVWNTEARKDTASYCSSIFIELPERKLLVTMSQHYLMGIDCASGELLWDYLIEGYEAPGDHCNSPVFYDGDIYQIMGDRNGIGAVKLSLSPDGSSVKEMWMNKKVKNNFSGLIIHNDLLFTTIRGNQIKALELEQGTVVDSIKVSAGAIIFSDNKFITYGYNGEVNLINYLEGKLNIGGTFKVEQGSGQHFSHPVLDNGVMYIRHGDVLMAYRIQ